MADNKDKKVLNVPALRFPEFTEEWQGEQLHEIAELSKGTGISKEQLSENGTPCILYGELYTKYKSEIISKVISKTDIEESKLKHSKQNDVIIPCSGETAIDIAVARCVPFDNVLLGGDLNVIRLHKYDGAFMAYQLNGKRKTDIAKLAQGVSVVHLYGENLKSIKTYNPSLQEQQKIVKLLSMLDERLEVQNKIIEKLETLIKGIRHKVFRQLRKDFGFNSTIGDILSFEQPQRYIVSSAEYSNDDTFIPVLTANKAFILGYTTETDGIYDKGDCIIIDDFTLDCKYVSFPFKVKSSAIKILTASNKFILRYTYEYLKSLELSTEEHKRHYIAEIQPYSCVLPDENTLKTIALVFENLAYKLANEQSLALILNKQRQYLLSKMFI